MNVLEAEEIIRGYAEAIGRGTCDGGIARYESLLPCSKEKIIQAYKIFMGYVAKFKPLTTEEFEQYFVILNMIDSFISDEEAKKIDTLYKRLRIDCKINDNEQTEYKPYFDYILHMAMSDKHDEVVDFFNEINKLNFNDILYCQRVYTLAGIEYNPEYKNYFQYNLLK